MAVDNSINSDDLRFWINNTISYGENPIQKFAQEQDSPKSVDYYGLIDKLITHP